MRIIYNHMLDSENIVASSEETNYPVTNLQDPLLFKTWRSTGVAAESIVIDAGVGNTFTFDCCVISGHNLTNAATIKFQMHTSDAWGAPDLDQTITWRDGHLVTYFTSTTKRFARFSFVDAANPDGYIEAGRVSASQYLQVDPSSIAQHKIDYVRDDVIIHTPSNNAYGTVTSLGRYRRFTYEFPYSKSDMVASIIAMYEAVGKVIPIYFMNFDTLFTVIEPAYVIIETDIEMDWYQKRARYSLTLRETGGFNGG